ncbi:MAG: hypothetical protein KGZ25_13580 [Planctomycetes bacterium]|nr:hypothetical protein [Planctomycetota bacterium]
MTSREIVRRCIEFKDPPRVGLHLRVCPIDGKQRLMTDFAGIRYAADPNVELEEGYNEWRVKRETFDPTGENMGQVKDFPLAEGWHLLKNYPLPDFSKESRYEHLEEQVEAGHAKGKYVYGPIPTLMQTPADLRGMDNWFMDHILHREELCELLDFIIDARLRIIEEYGKAGADGAITYDDMGLNERPVVSPELFRSIYFPRYKKTCDALHEWNMHFIHHCCGYIRPYIPMFIEAGCDVLQLDQPKLSGINWLSENVGGELCFWNPVDIQRTVGNNDLEAIADEAHHQTWALGKFGGGFMVKAYQQPNAIGMTQEEFEAQYEAFLKYAEYPLEPYPQSS